MKPTEKQFRNRWLLGAALNFALLFALPMLSRATGRIESDILPRSLAALLATGAVMPGIGLLCVGDTEQKLIGLCLCLFPIAILVLIASWAVSYW